MLELFTTAITIIKCTYNYKKHHNIIISDYFELLRSCNHVKGLNQYSNQSKLLTKVITLYHERCNAKWIGDTSNHKRDI